MIILGDWHSIVFKLLTLFFFSYKNDDSLGQKSYLALKAEGNVRDLHSSDDNV